MNKQEILAHVDHTLLKPEATWQEIKTLCEEALAWHTASVCIQPCWVRRAAEYLGGQVAVCTVIGFPLGANTTQTKVEEAKTALQNGCTEFDMVINIGRLKMGDIAYVQEEIRAVKQAVGAHVLKVIVETCLLTQEEKLQMCEAVCAGGADYIKTSTGFSTAGATPADVALLVEGVRGRCKVKAAGGIRTREDMERFLAQGAKRLGTSGAIKLLAADAAMR